jgi:hypothetical protein
MTTAPHPAFSPDLAPSGFCRFGKVKAFLNGFSCGHEDEDLLLVIGF